MAYYCAWVNITRGICWRGHDAINCFESISDCMYMLCVLVCEQLTEMQQAAESLREELEAQRQEGKETRAEMEALSAQLLAQEKEVNHSES